MSKFEKRVAKVALRNADKIDEALQRYGVYSRAKKLLEVKKDIKSSYRRLSLRSVIETVVADGLVGLTAPLVVPGVISDYFSAGFGLRGGISDKIIAPFYNAVDHRKNVVGAKKEKNSAFKTLSTKVDAELSSAYASAPDTFSKIRDVSKKLRSQGELAAAFGFSADQKERANVNYRQLKNSATLKLRPNR